jgi:hypothetical protein
MSWPANVSSLDLALVCERLLTAAVGYVRLLEGVRPIRIAERGERVVLS